MNLYRSLSISLAILLFFMNGLIGQSHPVQVLDKSNTDVLIGCNVQLGEKVLFTDVNGVFIMDDDYDGEVKISYIGYEPWKQYITSSDAIIYLNPSASLLDVATISSSRHTVSLAEATVSLEVLKPSIIHNNNLVSMDDAMEKIPGVQMLGDSPSIRGGAGFSYGAGSRVMLLIDDIPALTMDGGVPNWVDIPIENIAQVEVLKGASSSLYGSAALNGIVNVRTGYAGVDPVTKMSVAYTSYRAPSDERLQWWDKSPSAIHLNFLDKRKINKLDIVTNAMYYNLDSYNKSSYEKRGRIGINTRYRITDKLSVNLNVLYNKANNSSFFLWRNQDSLFIGLKGAESVRTINRLQVDPGLQYFSDSGYKHYWRNRIAYNSNENSNEQGNIATSLFSEYQVTKLLPWGINAVGGITFSTVKSESDLYDNKVLKYTNLASYLQLQKKLFDRLRISLGSRWENNDLRSLQNDHIVPLKSSRLVSRAGLNYQVAKASYLRASWGQGYRFPSIAERYTKTSFSGLSIFPNSELRPETGWTSELGYKQGLKIGGWQGYIDVSGFYQSYKDMMEFVFLVQGFEVGFQSQNVGFTTISGFEIGIGSQSKIGKIPIDALIGYTYINPKYKNFLPSIGSSVDYNVIKYRSKSSFKMDLSTELNNWNLGVSLQTTSPMLAIDKILSNFGGIKEYREQHNITRNLLDFRVGYQYKKMNISVLLKNTLNQLYTIRPGLMEAPRNLSIKLGYEL